MTNENATIAAECRSAAAQPHQPRRLRDLLQRAADALAPEAAARGVEPAKFESPETDPRAPLQRAEQPPFGLGSAEDSEPE